MKKCNIVNDCQWCGGEDTFLCLTNNKYVDEK